MNIDRSKLSCLRQYRLRLANNQGWHFIFTKGTGKWAGRLVAILELKNYEANQYPRVIFILNNSKLNEPRELIDNLEPSIKAGLPLTGWKMYNLGLTRLWFHQQIEDVICGVGSEKAIDLDMIRMHQALYPVYKRTLVSGGLPFHAALIHQERNGILLSASGGMGKSTCCRRLPSSWHVLCDDETHIVMDNQGRYFTHPFPTWTNFSRSVRDVEQFVNLSAIFFLQQAKEDSVIPITAFEAIKPIVSSSMQASRIIFRCLGGDEKKQLKKELFENACQLSRAIPSFILRVSLRGKFWEKIEEAIKGLSRPRYRKDEV